MCKNSNRDVAATNWASALEELEFLQEAPNCFNPSRVLDEGRPSLVAEQANSSNALHGIISLAE